MQETHDNAGVHNYYAPDKQREPDSDIKCRKENLEAE
jgi:hypothetical protein